MKRVFIILLLLGGAGYWAWTSGKLTNPTWIKSTSFADKPAEPVAPTVNEPEADLIARWESYGMPSLDAHWDAEALKRVSASLEQMRTRAPGHMPDAKSAADKAFFAKLRYQAGKFHLLSSANKISTYNAYKEILPVYGKSLQTGRSCDLEAALLIGLQVELIAGVMEDQAFVKSFSDRTTRTSGSLDGGTWTMRGESITFIGGVGALETDTRELLEDLSDRRVFAPDARKLALSLLAQHLPTVARRADIQDLRPLLQTQRAKETDPEVRAYYDTLLARL